MKKLIYLLSAISFAGAIALGVSACERTIEPIDFDACWVIVRMTDEQSLLLARSWVSSNETYSAYKNYESYYGEGNVTYNVIEPISRYSDGTYGPMISPDCYEITMIIDYSHTSVPSAQDLLHDGMTAKSGLYGFMAVKIDGNTVTTKWYDWAATEEDVEQIIRNTHSRYKAYGSDVSGRDGTIVDTAIKNIGPEIRDMPMEF